ncbi:hypothetical protein BH09BAC6_BH09BAC6_22900 [soil metagenome]|jgi:hypothetical protein
MSKSAGLNKHLHKKAFAGSNTGKGFYDTWWRGYFFFATGFVVSISSFLNFSPGSADR